jgi:hypothetical protein
MTSYLNNLDGQIKISLHPAPPRPPAKMHFPVGFQAISNMFSFIISFIHQWVYSPLLGSGRFFSFVILYRVRRTPWTGDQPIARQLPTHRTAQRRNKRTQTPMSVVEFKPTTPVFERGKTVHASGSALTVIGRLLRVFSSVYSRGG